MLPFLIQLLPTALEIVKLLIEQDSDKDTKREEAVQELVRRTGCKERHARCTTEYAYNQIKEEDELPDKDTKINNNKLFKDNNNKNWKKELTQFFKNHNLLPTNYTGNIVLIFNSGGIRNVIRKECQTIPL